MKTSKYIWLLAMILIVGDSIAQGKYLTKNGIINFEASVPSFEEVKAKNEAVTAILNTDNGEIAALALMKGFRFKVALMEEHFNENYMESDDYPKATFKGKLENFDSNNLQPEYDLSGTLTLHGKSKDIRTKVSLSEKEGLIVLGGAFTVKPEDFDIEIPSIVSNKIAEEVDVSINFELKKR